MKCKSDLLLVDGNGLAWRVITGQGHATVFYGVTRRLLDLREMYPGFRVILVFDGGRSVLRTSVDQDYKANRKPSPDRTRVLQGLIALQQGLELLGANFIRVNGVEADDVISILAKRAEDTQTRAVIVSDDQDFFQCLSGSVTQFIPRLNREIGAPEALADWRGCRRSFILWKALAGDTGDNIPGFPGIAKKRAHELVAVCRGEWRRLFGAQAKRLFEEKHWAEVLWKPGAIAHFARQVRLVKTAEYYDEVAPGGDLTVAELATAVDRSLDRLKNPEVVTSERWIQFMHRFDAFHLMSKMTALEDLYAFRLELTAPAASPIQ